MSHRTWKLIKQDKQIEIKQLILKNSGLERNITSPLEKWRFSVDDSTFIFYHTGTLYATPSSSNSSLVRKTVYEIDMLVESKENLKYDYLLGFDETGKGELFGSIFLVGVAIPVKILPDIINLVSSADSKKTQNDDYWFQLYDKLLNFKTQGLEYLVTRIKPEEILAKNLNNLLDLNYLILIKEKILKLRFHKFRLVVDDYGMNNATRQDIELSLGKDQDLVVATNSEEQYFEVKVASLIAKKYRTNELLTINESPDYQIDKVKPGNGNTGNFQTQLWLSKWQETGKAWPWFVKKSFKTLKQIR